jgi:hypothetical protein
VAKSSGYKKRQTCSKLLRGVTGNGIETIPDVESFYGISATRHAVALGVSEASILRVVRSARHLVMRGWCQRVAWCDSRGDTLPGTAGPATHFSLVGAIRTAGEGELVCEYALKLVRKVLGERGLNEWNDNPVRVKGDILWLLDRTIELACGQRPRRGGWSVSVPVTH